MKTKIITIITLMIFAIPGISANAETAVKISNIKKVENIKAVEKSTPLSFSQTLRRGVKNENVRVLQKKLQELGYYTKALDADYGSGTLAAVIQFQLENGLTPDGVAGPKTFAKILAAGNYTLPPIEIDKPAGVCTADYTPVCGQKVINCVTTPCPQPAPQTFGNKCNLNNSGAIYLYSGECKNSKPIEDTKPEISIREKISKYESEIKRMKNSINELEERIKGLKKEL